MFFTLDSKKKMLRLKNRNQFDYVDVGSQIRIVPCTRLTKYIIL